MLKILRRKIACVGVFGNDLRKDQKVAFNRLSAALLGKPKLYALDTTGKAAVLSWTKEGDSYVIEAGGAGAKFIGGTLDFGWFGIQGGRMKCVKLTYCAKAIIGSAPAEGKPQFRNLVPFEVVPMLVDGKLRFQTFWKGAPLAGTEFGVTVGQATEKRVAADERGITKMSFDKPARYEVWAHYTDNMAAESGGRTYDESRFYATLVMDFRGSEERPHRAGEAMTAADDRPIGYRLASQGGCGRGAAETVG
jgi:hypothetical protein